MEEPYVDKARNNKIDPMSMAAVLLRQYPHKIIIPQDMVAVNNLTAPSKFKTVDFNSPQSFPGDWAFADIGPKTQAQFLDIIKTARTVFWDGPLGKYELNGCQQGTLSIAQAIAVNSHTTVLAGGDTAAAAEKFDLIFNYTHVSIAGGAALEYLAGRNLPGIDSLLDQ